NLSACLVFSPAYPKAATDPSGETVAEAGAHELRVQYASGISESLAEKLVVQRGQGAGGVAYASSTQRLIPEVNGSQENDSLLKELVQRQQIRSALFVPMEGD